VSIFETLGELIGGAFKALFDSISGLLKFKGEQLSDIDRELAEKSLDPDKYENPEVKKLVKDLKDSLKHSPEGISEWIEDVFTKVFGTVSDVITRVMIPFDAPDFETAKANAGYLTSAFTGFILLASTLDAVSTALSGTLVRNVFRYIAFMLQFFGFQRYMDIALMPAVNASILPRLAAGYNKQYQATIPPLPDMIRFADFGSFDPEIIEAWREFYDAPGWIREPMSLSGIGGDWANKYWFSHWRQPGRYELGELHRRGLIDDDTVKKAYLTQGFTSFWQGHLLELVKEPWTRVDVRRMWDMRTIDETQLRKAYRAVGYYDEQLEGMVLWTKIYVAFPDLIARWTKGWITIDEVRSQLTGLGMPPERVEEMIQMKIKPEEPGRVEEGRALTKTEIYKGVKKELISWGEGIELLRDLGYDENEADYILSVNVGALEGSPETYEEFKDWTTKYKIATGREAKPMPEELKAAAAEVVRLTGEVEALERSIEEEKRGLIEVEAVPAEATRRLKKLQVSRNRAIAELERAKSEYDKQVAEWRHGIP